MTKNIFVRKTSDVRESGRSGPAQFFLATVATVSGPEGLTLIPDGQDEAIPKKYKVLTAGTAPPAVGDRVVVMRHSGTCVILGSIGLPEDMNTDARISDIETEIGEIGTEIEAIGTELSKKVAKAGDTMTGDLTINDHQNRIHETEITIGTAPESNKWSHQFRIEDSAGKSFARLQGFYGSDGRSGAQLYGENYVNGTNNYNFLGLYVSASGVASVAMNYPAAWRSALGLGTNGALPLTIAQGGSGQTQVTTVTTLANIATAGSNVTLTSASFCQWGKVAMLGINGNATASLAVNSLLCTIVSDKRPAISSPAQLWLSKDHTVVVKSNGEVQLGGSALSGGFTILAVYLLP